MPNPKGNPKTLRPKEMIGDKPLKKSIAIRIPDELDDRLNSLPVGTKQQFLRDVLEAAADNADRIQSIPSADRQGVLRGILRDGLESSLSPTEDRIRHISGNTQGFQLFTNVNCEFMVMFQIGGCRYRFDGTLNQVLRQCESIVATPHVRRCPKNPELTIAKSENKQRSWVLVVNVDCEIGFKTRAEAERQKTFIENKQWEDLQDWMQNVLPIVEGKTEGVDFIYTEQTHD